MLNVVLDVVVSEVVVELGVAKGTSCTISQSQNNMLTTCIIVQTLHGVILHINHLAHYTVMIALVA